MLRRAVVRLCVAPQRSPSALTEWHQRMIALRTCAAPKDTKPNTDRLMAEAVHLMTSNGVCIPPAICESLWDVFVTVFPKYRSLHNTSAYDMRNDGGTQGVSLDVQIRFFAMLAEAGTRYDAIAASAQRVAVEAAKHGDQLEAEIQSLRQVATPLFITWLEQSFGLPNGLRLVMAVRESLLNVTDAVARSTDVDDDVRSMLRNVGIPILAMLRDRLGSQTLRMKRLSWDKSPAGVFERIVEGEGVHPFASLAAARFRVAPTPCRELFAFFYPGIDTDPLVAVQVALSADITASVDTILHRPSPAPSPVGNESVVHCAIMYSINNLQKGLKGIDLGGSLIKSVVQYVQEHFPAIDTFSTLSPMPKLSRWVSNEATKAAENSIVRFLYKDFMSDLCNAFQVDTPALAWKELGRLSERDAWWQDARLLSTLRRPLLSIATLYILSTKQRGRALDPVAHFHLSNGACVYRINWLANCTLKGNRESFGIMINYRYDLDRQQHNANAYAVSGCISVDALWKDEALKQLSGEGVELCNLTS